ncbi:MAG TPA: membrane protein insertion efficiency factor YidD [Patescibacteria group bacterium]|nr:membrane protein insertion efficiency factor YidD [Patescibacteria group bacterium]
MKNRLKRLISLGLRLPAQAAVSAISIYQKLLSPDHSWLKARYPYGYCRHYPSCSAYAKQAITKYGLLKGGFLAAARVSRCNPLASPRVDLIP